MIVTENKDYGDGTYLQVKKMIIEQRLLPICRYTRSGIKTSGRPRGIVNHWVEGPRQDFINVENWFKSQCTIKSPRYGSAHYGLGFQRIVQWIPDNERVYAVGAPSYFPGIVQKFGSYPNDTTLNIEWCHPDTSGKPTSTTYSNGVWLNATKCIQYNLTANDIYLHRDFAGKECHKWFVNNPAEWAKFKSDVASKILELKEVEKKKT